jgi:hypothetical protein
MLARPTSLRLSKQLQAVAEQHVILDHLLRLLFHLAVKEAA